jgi:hypothetical protein
MPFEPRLFADDDRREPRTDAGQQDGDRCPICGAAVSAEEASGAALAGEERLALPADLAALADQLGDDAEHLAGRYPAADLAGRRRLARDERSRSANWIRWSAAVAIIMIVVTWPSVGENLTSLQRRGDEPSAGKDALASVDRGMSPIPDGATLLKTPSEVDLASRSGIEPVSVSDEHLSQPRHPPADELAMLRIQVSGFQKVIERLQDELAARDKSQAEMVKLIRSLQDEVAALKVQGAGPALSRSKGGNGQGDASEKSPSAKTAASAPK